MSSYVSALSIIWEKCIDEEICVDIPLIGRKCVRLTACVRLVNDAGTIYVEVEGFGRRFRYALTNACHTVFEIGIGKLRICIQTISGGVRLVLEGCIGVAGVKKCWTLFAQDIRFFALTDLTDTERELLGVSPALYSQQDIAETMGAIATPLLDAEIEQVLRQPEADQR